MGYDFECRYCRELITAWPCHACNNVPTEEYVRLKNEFADAEQERTEMRDALFAVRADLREAVAMLSVVAWTIVDGALICPYCRAEYALPMRKMDCLHTRRCDLGALLRRLEGRDEM
jgi:hypothetical protein